MFTNRKKRLGAAAIETALMLPVLVIVTLGAIDIAQYINLAQMVTNASREGGKMASSGDTVQEVEDRVIDYLSECMPQLTRDELEAATTIELAALSDLATSSSDEGTGGTNNGNNGNGNNGNGYGNSSDDDDSNSGSSTTTNFNGNLSSIYSGEPVSVSVSFDFSAVRWFEGPNYWNGNTTNSTTVTRRQ